MQSTAALHPAPSSAAVLIPRTVCKPGELRALLARVMTGESRRFAAAHLQVRLHVHLCDTWLGPAGWCMRPPHHAGSCLPIPASYDPQGVAS